MKLFQSLFIIGLFVVSACAGSSGQEETSAAPLFQKDLVYATTSTSQKLDISVPAGNGPFPLVIYVHGGGWRAGDKDGARIQKLTAHFVAQGYAVASLNYRLSGEAIFPAQIFDVKTATRWLRAHAQEFRLDPTRFAAWGDSAGGELVSLLGTSCGVSELEGAELGNPDQSSCVQAVVDFYGPTDPLVMDEQAIAAGCPAFHNSASSGESQYIGGPIQENPDEAKASNPITYVSADDPPFFIQHGALDCTVPPQQSQILFDALKPAIGAEYVILQYLDGAEHGDKMFFEESNLALVVEFLNQRLN